MVCLDGRIVEKGSFIELVAEKGKFARLIEEGKLSMDSINEENLLEEETKAKIEAETDSTDEDISIKSTNKKFT